MLCQNSEQLTTQSFSCQILNVQLQSSICRSVFNGFQQHWSQNLSNDML